MAERKNSASPSTHSRGVTVVFAKQVQRKFSRAHEKVLQRFGKSEETRDEQFDIHVQNLSDQQNDGHRIYKDLKAYINAVKVMRDASSRLFQSLFDIYELDWEGGEDLGAVVEGEDLLWNDYETKLRDQALLTMESYMCQFPDIKEKVAKRGRKLVDYDSSRHHLESLENAKKRDDIKIGKAKEDMKTTQKVFEEMNQELKEELPILYDSRIGCYVTVFQAISNLRDIFFREIAQNNQNLQNIMKDLRAQHPDKSFVIKHFNRGSMKRRSLKDALSPRSLRASFSEFHMSYNPRSTLRREYSSSFRSERSSYEPYSPETSPTKPKHLEDLKPEGRDTNTNFQVDDNHALEATSISTTPVTDGNRGTHTAIKEEEPEDEIKTTKDEEPLSVTNQDVECDTSTEDCDEHGLEPSHYVKTDPNSSPLEAPEDHNNCPEKHNMPVSSEMKNGITPDHTANAEESGASCRDTTRTEVKMETKND